MLASTMSGLLLSRLVSSSISFQVLRLSLCGGMLASAPTIGVVADALRRYEVADVVLDPVCSPPA